MTLLLHDTTAEPRRDSNPWIHSSLPINHALLKHSCHRYGKSYAWCSFYFEISGQWTVFFLP